MDGRCAENIGLEARFSRSTPLSFRQQPEASAIVAFNVS
jgi:hypothetical protein